MSKLSKGARNANSEMRRAEAFWERADSSLKRARYALVIERCLHRLLSSGRIGLVYNLERRKVEKKIEALSDLRITEEDNFYSAVEAARGAEMMARIYYEEGE